MPKRRKDSRLDQLFRAQAALLHNIRRSVETNTSLSSNQKVTLIGHVDQLARHFENSIQNADEAEFAERVKAFESAYYLGAYKVLSPQYFDEVVKTGRRQGMSVAREGTTAVEFQEYLAKIANKFWKKNKSYVGNFQGTATRIIDDVYRNMASVSVVPSRIGKKDISKKRDRELAIRSIAERLKNLP